MSKALFVALVGAVTLFACNTNNTERRRDSAGTAKALTPKEAVSVLPKFEGARELMAPRMVPQGRLLAQYCVAGTVAANATSVSASLHASWNGVSVRSPTAERRLVSATRGEYALYVSIAPGERKCEDNSVLLSMTVLKPLAPTPHGAQVRSTPHG